MGDAHEVVDAVERAAEGGGDRVTVGQLNDELGHRSTGALMALPALLELTPVGGIPGVPTVLAVIVAIFAVQIALGRDDMWLPDVLERRAVGRGRLRKAADWMKRPAEWIDRHFGERLTVLTGPAGTRAAAVAILLLCATVPPLEVVPFASSIPMATIALFGFAMILRDGLAMAVAWAAFAAAAVGVWWLLP
ncbi:exopolysaccharide biosynthesis protein [Jannaschia sp. W003]|uniref:exopolysaccharide biosynthesis protein n=1 Tax=Jannaschia sp. W003 TaxID=2867012 RepID=UPI0021A50FDB|nr:exopolysaccharide biosynthesis protein [Jannaschia sp. W003]UWQ20933.1 exopolysaccharide biosynthesis protein [Jannaschia sp. W003]